MGGEELALVQEETGYWNICWTQTGNSYMRFQVITAVSMKFRVFWDVAPRSHVQVYQRFRNAYYLHLQDNLMMEAVCTSEMSVHKRDYMALHPRRIETLKFLIRIINLSN
jgi:hypothetical protein